MKKTETEHKMTVDFILYPGLKEELTSRIKSLIQETNKSIIQKKETVKAILVPHAGWSHCDKIMASAYAAVAKRNFKRVVILSRVHREPAKSIFLPEFLSYISPLGETEVDHIILSELSKSDTIFEYNNVPHVEEHSIEVQIPFIKYLWPKAKIVPILTGKSTGSITRKLAESLNTVFDDKMDNTLFIVSSSISAYETGNKSRQKANRFISILNNKEDWKTLPELLNEGEISACSADCLSAVLTLFNNSSLIEVLNTKYWESLEEKEKRVCFGAISIS
ncbi:MAG: AmmeMemoRadiSam system protein B [Spirochaetia bacterium]|jgi:AmmeMemoRadiSam system protein B|nr:AmmeMemoRadiSam system protein B [Spirochaetia bacterium]